MLIGAVVTSLLACDSIYDDPNDIPEVIPVDKQAYQNVDCTSYTAWTYLSLHEPNFVTLDYKTEEVPIDWDIAIHRYDVKTNGGAAFETKYSTLAELREAINKETFQIPAASEWVEDEMGEVYVDMSHMTEGYLISEPAQVNKEISKWMNVDLETMPPIYTTSGRVYLLKLNDGTIAAIRFTSYFNPQRYNAKGYISFDYIHPLSLEKQ